ncbi:MAG: patatin-like phospholipase family protein [Bacteroidota bacterium]
MSNRETQKQDQSAVWLGKTIGFLSNKKAALAMGFLLVVALIGMYSNGTWVSPLIIFPEHAIGSLNSWAQECIGGGANYYFFFDAIFAVCLCYLCQYFLIQLGCRSKVWLTFPFIALLFDFFESVFYLNKWQNIELIQFLKILFYTIAWCSLIFYVSRKLFRKIGNFKSSSIALFLKNYLPFFYPGIISITLLILMINSLDQFDALIIELSRGLNLLIFAFAFLSTIIKVWFMPYYVQFSQVYYDKLEPGDYKWYSKKVTVSQSNFSKATTYKGAFTTISSLLNKEIVETADYGNSIRKNKSTEDKASKTNSSEYSTVRTNPIIKSIGSTLKSLTTREQNQKEKELAENLRVRRSLNLKVRPLSFYDPLKGGTINESEEQKTKRIESLFHIIRRHWGLLFIIILIWLQLKTLCKLCSFPEIVAFFGAIAVGSLLFFILNSSYKKLTTRSKNLDMMLQVYEEIDRIKKSINHNTEEKLIKLKEQYVNSKVIGHLGYEVPLILEKERLREVYLNKYFTFLLLSILFTLFCSLGPEISPRLFELFQGSLLSITLFLVTTFLFGLTYIYFSLFRYPVVDISRQAMGKNEIVEQKLVLLDSFQVFFTKSLMVYGTILTPLVFLIAIIWSLLFRIDNLHWLNPINYYLIIVNGAICLLTLAHRIFTIKYIKSKYTTQKDPTESGEKRNILIKLLSPTIQMYKSVFTFTISVLKLIVNLFIWFLNIFSLLAGFKGLKYLPIEKIDESATFYRTSINKRTYFANIYALSGVVILLLIALSNRTNFHHEINYLSTTQSSRPEISFEGFTRNFLAEQPISKDSTTTPQKIYCIAAEGGGLRAAYWTLLVLNQLKPEVIDRTFMMTGASGGAIGLAMYNFLLAEGKTDSTELFNITEMLGSHNYLTTDAAGILTRGVAGQFIPWEGMKGYWDRHRYMAKTYFDLMRLEGAWEKASDLPFYHAWQDSSRHLPMLVVNTTKTIDGTRAVVHPFPGSESPFSDNFTDLSSIQSLSNQTTGYISYADAVFLTNRFPFVSPPARIEGRGYFVDGGYYDNSGIQTILHTLSYLKSLAEIEDSPQVYHDFFDTTKYEIEVINIRNSQSAYFRELVDTLDLSYQDVNRIGSRQQIGNILSAATNAGLTALPNYYHFLFKNEVFQTGLGLVNYHTIDLPYRLKDARPLHNSLNGQIQDLQCDLIAYPGSHDATIKESLSEELKHQKYLEPPLGRMLPYHTRLYMQDMLRHGCVKSKITDLNRGL